MDTNSNAAKMIGGVLVLALIVGGIFALTSSSDDDEDDTATTTTQQTQTTESQASAAPVEVAQSNIVELAIGSDALSTLVAAVQAADLVNTLADETAEFTVFAPTNDAFAALPEGTLDSLLLPENKADLSGILTYHVVAGEVNAADLSDGQVIETVNGDTLTVSIDGGVVKIGDATVVTADVDASNGVVHIIDTVLLPN